MLIQDQKSNKHQTPVASVGLVANRDNSSTFLKKPDDYEPKDMRRCDKKKSQPQRHASSGPGSKLTLPEQERAPVFRASIIYIKTVTGKLMPIRLV